MNSAAQRFFLFGAAAEAGLLAAALAFNWLLGQPLWADWHWDGGAVLLGGAAAVPMLAGFVWSLRRPRGPMIEISGFLEDHVRPMFGSWSIGQLALISLLAGVGEELFFRGMAQAALSRWLGPVPGLLLASLLFGVFHPMTRGYLVLATALGLYLGGLWWWSGNLLAPVVAHGLYDFLALVYFIRIHRAPAGSD